MKKTAPKTPYFIDRYVRCGDMPLFLLFCHDRKGRERYCIMLCPQRILKKLLRLKKGFSDPAQYGRVLVKGHGRHPSEVVREILKARYDFDFEKIAASETGRF